MSTAKLWRTMAYGEPNTWKTSVALDTAPRPICWIHAPGEGGHATLVDTVSADPDGYKDIYLAPFCDPFKSPGEQLAQLERNILECVKKGPQTIVFEGLNKLQHMAMDFATDGKYTEGVQFEGGNWSKAERRLTEIMDRLRENMIPLVHLTCWEVEKAPYKVEGAAKVIKPNLVGQFAQNIFGMGFNIFRQYLKKMDKLDANGRPVYRAMWRVKPGTNLRAALKGPRSITDAFPVDIPADFRVLFDTWTNLHASPPKERA